MAWIIHGIQNTSKRTGTGSFPTILATKIYHNDLVADLGYITMVTQTCEAFVKIRTVMIWFAEFMEQKSNIY